MTTVSPAGIGAANRRYLERLHRELPDVFGVERAAQVLGLDREQTGRLLVYLARRGWLSRVRRGMYVTVPLDARQSGSWVGDPWIVAQEAFAPCYMGGWTAAEQWDLTEQVFRSILVVTARRVRHRDVDVRGATFRLTVRPEERLFGTVAVWRDQTRVQVSDPSRTIVDVLDDPTIGGGIRTSADMLHEYIVSKHRNDSLLIDYAERLGNHTVFKRLGYLAEREHLDTAELVAACLQQRSAGLSSLDPSVKSIGRIVRRWGLRVNVDLREPEDES